MRKFRHYPLTYNPIREYWQAIKDGREVVSKKVYKTYKYLVYQLENPGEYSYNPARANHVIEFLRITATIRRVNLAEN